MKLLDITSLYWYNADLLKYYELLSPEIPDFILEYANTKEMLKQQYISITCGTYYSKLYDNNRYSSLEHSIAVALIVRNFTKDKKQALSWLFHDISTPVFKHAIDYMNWDYHNQETTEDLTTEIISNSEEIMALLKRDNIKIEEINDYHLYPIADNNTPQLSADRLEYTISNAFFTYNIVSFEEIKKWYNDIKILKNENNEVELGFTHKTIAEIFEKNMSKLSIIYMLDETRYSMQLLADILKIMHKHNEIQIQDLYNLKESEIIEKIQNSKIGNIKECFNIWLNAKKINISKTEPKNCYFVHHWTKIRYIDPLIQEENNQRISTISPKAKEYINNCLNFDMNNYIYLDFQLQD